MRILRRRGLLRGRWWVCNAAKNANIRARRRRAELIGLIIERVMSTIMINPELKSSIFASTLQIPSCQGSKRRFAKHNIRVDYCSLMLQMILESFPLKKELADCSWNNSSAGSIVCNYLTLDCIDIEIRNKSYTQNVSATSFHKKNVNNKPSRIMSCVVNVYISRFRVDSVRFNGICRVINTLTVALDFIYCTTAQLMIELPKI